MTGVSELNFPLLTGISQGYFLVYETTSMPTIDGSNVVVSFTSAGKLMHFKCT